MISQSNICLFIYLDFDSLDNTIIQTEAVQGSDGLCCVNLCQIPNLLYLFTAWGWRVLTIFIYRFRGIHNYRLHKMICIVTYQLFSERQRLVQMFIHTPNRQKHITTRHHPSPTLTHLKQYCTQKGQNADVKKMVQTIIVYTTVSNNNNFERAPKH